MKTVERDAPQEDWDKRVKTMMLEHDMKSLLARLELQRGRILEQTPRRADFIQVVHDADYYIILLRRLYRHVQDEAEYDSRVANLKGKYKQLVDEIRMRDHFEHDVDPANMPPVSTEGLSGISGEGKVTISTSVFIGEEGARIVSGEHKWDLREDHNQFVELIREFVRLYPFHEKPIDNSSLWRKLRRRLARFIYGKGRDR